jgi:acyl dehydratase
MSTSTSNTIPQRTIEGIDGLKALVGQEIGVSDWREISQDLINRFADATDDHQWIHIDVERARRESPFGTTIAHGYLILSLVAPFNEEIFTVDGVKLVVNYGLNKVRFVSPVPAGSQLRMRSRLAELTEVPGGHQAVLALTLEREGEEKPACVVEQLVRFYA